MSDRIFFPYSKELKLQKKLYLEGFGGAMVGDIQKVNGYYVSYEYLTIEQARKLYVEVVEGCLLRYNQNEEIRPYLHNYPFAITNMDIKIYFRNVRQHKGRCYVAFMFIGRDNYLIYRTYDENDQLIPLHEEPYEVARDIVLNNNSSIFTK